MNKEYWKEKFAYLWECFPLLFFFGGCFFLYKTCNPEKCNREHIDKQDVIDSVKFAIKDSIESAPEENGDTLTLLLDDKGCVHNSSELFWHQKKPVIIVKTIDVDELSECKGYCSSCFNGRLIKHLINLNKTITNHKKNPFEKEKRVI